MLQLPRAGLALLGLSLCLSFTPVTAGALDPITPAQHEARKAAANANTVGVITGPVGEAYLRITADMASVVDDGESLRVLPIAGKGGAQNITDLLYLKGVDVAIVQSDVLATLREKGLHYDIDKRVEYVTKLFNEEVHLVAREGIQSVSDLEGRRVNFGPVAGGAEMTGEALFAALSVRAQISHLEDAQALAALKRGEIDAMLSVAPAPTALYSQITAQDRLHLVAIPYTDKLPAGYVPTSIDAKNYPGLSGNSTQIESVSVSAVMVVFAWPKGGAREQRLTRFITRFFDKFDNLLAPAHHPKWQEVNLAADLPGWRRNGAAQAWLASHSQGATVSAAGGNELMQKFIDWQAKAASQP
jgi:TRAP transporter TAXI family solute receptor